jgi:hypothetical protein
MTDDRGQMTEDRGQKTEDRGQKTEDRGPGGWEAGRQKTDDRGQKTEGRRQMTEGRWVGKKVGSWEGVKVRLNQGRRQIFEVGSRNLECRSGKVVKRY